MGLDTYFYGVDKRTIVNPKTKETIEYEVSTDNEIAYFRKNYCLMEWFEKHWQMEVENCVDYLVDKDDIDALLKDCQLAIDLVDEASNCKELEYCDVIEDITPEIEEQLKKLFPMNSWRRGRRWNNQTQSYDETERNFDGRDYEELKEIIRSLSDLSHWKYNEKMIFHNWW